MSTPLLRCTNLKLCDKYFGIVLKGDLLGDLEPKGGELQHLSKIIARELKERPTNIQGSISMAIFLVWIGYLHYQEGNYWGPVYRKLELPDEQAKWQGILGATFLKAVKEHDLYDFRGGLSYVIPILAHGYIPNCYLNNFATNVLLPIYTDWKQAHLEIGWDEVKHLVTSWREEFTEYEKYSAKINDYTNKEKKLKDMCAAWHHKDLLAKLKRQQDELICTQELTDLLSVSQLQLAKLENRKAELEMLLERMSSYGNARVSYRTREQTLKALDKEIVTVAAKIFENWHSDFADLIMDLSLRRAKTLVENVEMQPGILFRIRLFFYRLFVPAKYKRLSRKKSQLEELVAPLHIKEDVLEHPNLVLLNTIQHLQELLRKYDQVALALAEAGAALEEMATACRGMHTDDKTVVRRELDKITQELSRYKTKLVQLGKGCPEDGKEILATQKELRRNISRLRAQLSQDADVLIQYLPRVEKETGIDDFEAQLGRISELKKEVNEKAKAFRNPLYQLNESTRVFIFQGGEAAIQFIHESLLLIEHLQKNNSGDKVALPCRIKNYIKKWWESEGKEAYEATIVGAEREKRRKTKSLVRGPVLKFDSIREQIMVSLPPQPVNRKERASFYIEGNSGPKQKITLLLFRDKETDVLWSEAAEFPLSRPQQQYVFLFICGDIRRSWKYSGIGPDNPHLLFDRQGKLLQDKALPDDGVYLIAPIGSSTDPAGAIREQMVGQWSGYEYRYIDTQVLMVRTDGVLSIYKGRQQLQPQLLPGVMLEGIDSEGAPVFLGWLPDLVFSVQQPEEVPFYGIRFDRNNESKFFPLKGLDAVRVKDDIVHTHLDTLNQGKYGHYKITLVKSGNILWQADCAVIPDLQPKFDRRVYKVQGKDREKGRLEFCCRNKCEFVPTMEADQTVTSVSPQVVEFDTRQNVIKGSLICYLKEQVSLNINAHIPAVRWRLQDADWKATVEEIWYEDLGVIEIKVPPAAGTEIKLSLEDGMQILTSRVHRNIAVFDLNQFSDTLRGSDKPVQKITMSCKNEEIPPFILFRVRTRWQVEDIKVTQRLETGKRNLIVEWKELGKSSNRVLRFWPLNMPGVDYIETDVPDGCCSIETEVEAARMPPGLYRLELTMYDPWSSDAAVAPRPGTPNCQDIDIGSKEELLEAYLGKRLEMVALRHHDKIISVEPNYWVEVTGLSPTFEGEARLEGNVFTTAADGTIENMCFNPVSFYLKGNKIPFLIDKDKDGATYCRKCKMWFWEIGHLKCGAAVILPDSIYIRVRDDT